ncbi:pyruvate synthase subunit beta [Candidatus Micrarchaeota archaeon]|nr:pyruvate synthase subunit beta [Candidatus Micrarchaeota archaeon]
MTKTTETHLYAPGHAGCPGCGPSTTMIQVADALGKDAIIVNATGCMEITSSQYPTSAWRLPYVHVLFENAPAVASGIAAALHAKGNSHTRVAVIAGDGSTYDIGFGALSGMLERGDDVLYVCYNNENYANTGVQKSGATPFGAATTTTPAGSKLHGKTTDRKPLFEIVAAHEPAYAATASIAFIADLKNKLKKAIPLHGPRFIDINAPCALGAGFDGGITAQVARLAVQTRMWPLLEYEKSAIKLNFNPAPPKPVEEYLKLQKRFKHLTPEDVKQVQKHVDAYWERLMNKVQK